MDTFQLLRTFVRIIDAGSISKAARTLRLSVPMASRHLQMLEADLGATLLLRTTRKLQLTEAGEEFLGRARALLADLEEAREAVRPGTAAAGLLVISVSVTFGLLQVVPLLPGLMKRHPLLRLDVRLDDRAVDLLGEGIDLAIRAGLPPPDSPFVMARRLSSFRRVLCASPAFLRANGPIRAVEDLEKVPCIVQGPLPTSWLLETAQGPRTARVDGSFRSGNIIVVKEAALSGLGIAQLPEWLVAEDFAQRRLAPVLEGAQLPLIFVHGVFHQGARSSRSVRAVLDHLEKELPGRLSHVAPRVRAASAKPRRGRAT